MAQSWAPCAKLASLTEKSLRQEIIVSYARKVITTQFFEGMAKAKSRSPGRGA